MMPSGTQINEFSKTVCNLSPCLALNQNIKELCVLLNLVGLHTLMHDALSDRFITDRLFYRFFKLSYLSETKVYGLV